MAVTSVDALLERLAAAERVCLMFGWTGSTGTSDHDKALHELWSDWVNLSGVSQLPRDHPELGDDRIAELARQRDEKRSRALARIYGDDDG